MLSSGEQHRSISTLVILGLLGLLAGGVQQAAAQGTRLLRDPDVGPTHIVFVHANDLWLVGRDGGDALRLTSGAGAETDPAFSPDGGRSAVTAEQVALAPAACSMHRSPAVTRTAGLLARPILSYSRARPPATPVGKPFCSRICQLKFRTSPTMFPCL